MKEAIITVLSLAIIYFAWKYWLKEVVTQHNNEPHHSEDEVQ
jgi:hypothetical protein